MSWARNGLALASLPHEDTPLQHLQSADNGSQGTTVKFKRADMSLDRGQRSCENLPRQRCLGCQAQHDVHPLAKQVVLPRPHFLVL